MKFIRKIERAPMSTIAFQPVPLQCGKRVWWEFFAPMEEIPIVELAAVNVREDVDGGVHIFRTQIEAVLKCELETLEEPACYRLTDIQGRTFLVGLPTEPFPIERTQTNVDERPSGIASKTLVIEWGDIYPPLEII